jgi:uncharacterized membrane protein (UPF0136 family)
MGMDAIVKRIPDVYRLRIVVPLVLTALIAVSDILLYQSWMSWITV